jgi:hypothetical protein
MVYNAQNYWSYGLCPTSGILNTRKQPFGNGICLPPLIWRWKEINFPKLSFLLFRIRTVDEVQEASSSENSPSWGVIFLRRFFQSTRSHNNNFSCRKFVGLESNPQFGIHCACTHALPWQHGPLIAPDIEFPFSLSSVNRGAKMGLF